MRSVDSKPFLTRVMEMNFPILFFSLVVNHQLQNTLIFWVSLVTVFYYFVFKKRIVFNNYVFIPFGMLVVMFLGVFYSENVSYAWIIFSRNLGLFFLPVLLMLNTFKLNKATLKESFKLLEVSVFILIILSVFFLIINYCTSKTFNVYSPGSGSLVGKLFLGPYLSRSVGLHNIYFAFFIGVLLLFKIFVQQKFKSITYWTSLIVLAAYFICLKSANIMLSLSFFILVFLLLNLKIKKGFKFLFGCLVIVSSFYVIKSKIPNLSFQLNYNKPYYNSSLELRMLTWNVALENIQKHPFTGVGTGDLKKVMTEGFEEKKFEWGVSHRYDPHNQFLSYWLQNGVLQLLLFFLLLVVPVIRSFRRKDFFMLTIVILLLSFCLTESVLMTQTGLFASLIILYVASVSKVKFD